MIEIKNLHFTYKNHEQISTEILKDISLTIRDGEFVAIQGPSGSGKSTLLHLLGLFLTDYSGSIKIDGKELNTFNDLEKAKYRGDNLGFVFQQFFLLSQYTVKENIFLPTHYPSELPPFNVKQEEFDQLLKLLDIEKYLDYYPPQLSGGGQQRVAILRALIKNPSIILADEPTGNLDSNNANYILEILRRINQLGKTVVIITHDNEVAKRCDRIISIKDGKIFNDQENNVIKSISTKKSFNKNLPQKFFSINEQYSIQMIMRLLTIAFKNILQHKIRSSLTMLGIIIGIAAIFAMITLGSFTKDKVIESYSKIGANTIAFTGTKNWWQKATDKTSIEFREFTPTDFKNIMNIFPDIKSFSPTVRDWDEKIIYKGIIVDQDVEIVGINHNGLSLLNRKLLIGRNFSPLDVESQQPLCIVGYDYQKKFFKTSSPIGKIIFIHYQSTSYSCKVIGLLDYTKNGRSWEVPNLQIYMTYKLVARITNRYISKLVIQFKNDSITNLTENANALKKYFVLKYKTAGEFSINEEDLMISQMKLFLTLLTVVMGIMALITLIVGGIGITNMMLASISERLHEIGIRKACGATDKSIRLQYILESSILCSIAGIMGIIIGFAIYQGTLFVVSKLLPTLEYTWIFNYLAFFIAIISFLLVGFFSGLIPAIKAEKMQIIDSLKH